MSVLGVGKLAAGLVGALLLAGCNGGASASSDQTVVTVPDEIVPTATPTASTEIAAVQSIIDAHDRLVGAALRDYRAHGVPSAAIKARFQALLGGMAYRQWWGTLGASAAEGWARWKPSPSDPVTRVERIVEATPTCWAFRAQRVYDFMAAGPSADPDSHVVLHPIAPGADPQGLNPTGWALVADQSVAASPRTEYRCADAA